jgi:putative ABC transport system permease protein
MNDMGVYLVGGAFLLLNIFLGILGTFWFRTQQRKGEIALFKALAAVAIRMCLPGK